MRRVRQGAEARVRPEVGERFAEAAARPGAAPAVALAVSPAPAGPGAVVRQLEPALPGLVAARAEAFDETTHAVTLRVGAAEVSAALDPAVDPAVLRTAVARRERVIAQREPGGWVVLGALRTAATPGVDEGDEFLIKARRVVVVAAHELNLVSGAASLAVRAVGQVETLAQDISTRASGIHKIIGRMIRLN